MSTVVIGVLAVFFILALVLFFVLSGAGSDGRSSDDYINKRPKRWTVKMDRVA